MAFALEHMNVTPLEFWDLPPFAVINQMLIKSMQQSEENPNGFNRKEFVDMVRAQSGY